MPRFSADHGPRLTVKDIIDRVVEAIESGDENKARAVLDELFFDGCWPHVFSNEKHYDQNLLRANITGIIVAAFKEGKAQCE